MTPGSFTSSDLFTLGGRLHVLLVHLPIGFLALLVAIELLGRLSRFREVTAARGVVLVLSLLASIASVACGWILAGSGDYDAGLLAVHRWTGTAVAAACLVTLACHLRGWRLPYAMSLFVTFALVGAAGHFGGSLTHGRDFITRYMPLPVRRLFGEQAPRPAVTDPERAVAFADIVQPVLAARCGACHGAGKQMGGLRVDSIESLRKGGGRGPAVVAGGASKSPIIARMLLPAEDPQHMPPGGRPQPDEHELALIRWWIDTGASPDGKVEDLKPTARVYAALEKMFGTAAPAAGPAPAAQVMDVAEKLAGELRILIQPAAAGEPWLDVNASLLGREFGDGGLARLAAVGANIRRLDLGGTAVTDTGLVHVASMPNLTRLDLHGTRVTDAGLKALRSLRRVEYLNLYGTGVTDAGLQQLKRLVHLRRLYLWRTGVTQEGGKALAEELSDKDRLARLERSIEEMRQEISLAKVVVDMGAEVSAAAEDKPVNTVCPVSGKPVDPAKTIVYEGRRIAFCCNDCCAEFQKDPAKYAAKLNLEHP